MKKGLLEFRKKVFRPKIVSVSPQRNKRKNVDFTKLGLVGNTSFTSNKIVGTIISIKG